MSGVELDALGNGQMTVGCTLDGDVRLGWTLEIDLFVIADHLASDWNEHYLIFNHWEMFCKILYKQYKKVFIQICPIVLLIQS
jgi:uncharacterized membrane protein YpjA